MGLSIWQIAIVVVLVVLLFGRNKISHLMGDVAKGIKSFKKGMSSDPIEDDTPRNISEIRSPLIKSPLIKTQVNKNQIIKINSNATNWLV